MTFELLWAKKRRQKNNKTPNLLSDYWNPMWDQQRFSKSLVVFYTGTKNMKLNSPVSSNVRNRPILKSPIRIPRKPRIKSSSNHHFSGFFHHKYPRHPNTWWVGFWTSKYLLRRLLGAPNTYSPGIYLEDFGCLGIVQGECNEISPAWANAAHKILWTTFSSPRLELSNMTNQLLWSTSCPPPTKQI